MYEIDEEWATPADWAGLYRAVGWQVVPALTPGKEKSWKRPALKTWVEFQAQLVDDDLFALWYGESGTYAAHAQMGLITGACSGGVCIVDLDTPAHPEAAEWWRALLDEHNNGIEPETPFQVTGGGGLQYAFRFAEIPPTFKTSIGVDIRGAGGFAMLPSSMHESGRRYTWTITPDEDNVADAPEWLCEAIETLHAEHGGQAPRTRTASPVSVLSPISGQVTDGREQYMADMIWASMVDLRRDAPMISADMLEEKCSEKYALYVDRVKSRMAINGEDVHARLEREGRGWSEFQRKWAYAAKKWGDKVAEAALVEPTKEVLRIKPYAQHTAPDPAETIPSGDIYPLLGVAALKALPDPKWLVSGMIPEASTGFIFGAPGAGKTFVTLSLALSLATGKSQWWGRDIQRAGPVVYVSSEGFSDLKYRIAAWEGATKTDANDAPFFLMPDSLSLMDPTHVDRLARTIDALKEPPVMIVIDTVSRAMPGADENLQKEMTMFIAACDLLSKRFTSAVCGVHHQSRAGNNMRGSSVLDGAADWMYEITRDEGAMIGEMNAKKIKADRDGWSENFELETITVGPDTQSLFADKTTSEAKRDSGLPPSHVCKTILDDIDKRWHAADPFSTAPQSRAQGRYIYTYLQQRYSIQDKLARRMIEGWLLPDGLLSVDMVDKNPKRMGLRVVGRIGDLGG